MISENQSRGEMLVQIADGVAKLEGALQGLSEASLDLAAAPGEWSIRQIVHHLADDDDFWSRPLKRAVATPGAPIRLEMHPGLVPWADALWFNRREIAASLALIKAHRQMMAELARLCQDDWDSRYVVLVDRPGKPDKVLTLGWMMSILRDHLTEHLRTIEKIRVINSL